MWLGGNLKTFTIILQHHLQGEVYNPCTIKKQVDDKISIHVVIRFLLTVLLLRFNTNKSCCCRLRWNCRKESWWSWYHRFPSLGRTVLSQLGHEQLWKTFITQVYSFKYSRMTTSNAHHRFLALAKPQHNDVVLFVVIFSRLQSNRKRMTTTQRQCHHRRLHNKKEKDDDDIVVIFFFVTRRDRRKWRWHHCHLLNNKK